jgi:hypothetical protein
MVVGSVTSRTALMVIRHCIAKADYGNLNPARAPGIRETTLTPRYTEGPRLEPVVILKRKRKGAYYVCTYS